MAMTIFGAWHFVYRLSAVPRRSLREGSLCMPSAGLPLHMYRKAASLPFATRRNEMDSCDQCAYSNDETRLSLYVQIVCQETGTRLTTGLTKQGSKAY